MFPDMRTVCPPTRPITTSVWQTRARVFERLARASQLVMMNVCWWRTSVWSGGMSTATFVITSDVLGWEGVLSTNNVCVWLYVFPLYVRVCYFIFVTNGNQVNRLYVILFLDSLKYTYSQAACTKKNKERRSMYVCWQRRLYINIIRIRGQPRNLLFMARAYNKFSMTFPTLAWP